jgi:hypothetical protein
MSVDALNLINVFGRVPLIFNSIIVRHFPEKTPDGSIRDSHSGVISPEFMRLIMSGFFNLYKLTEVD